MDGRIQWPATVGVDGQDPQLRMYSTPYPTSHDLICHRYVIKAYGSRFPRQRRNEEGGCGSGSPPLRFPRHPSERRHECGLASQADDSVSIRIQGISHHVQHVTI